MSVKNHTITVLLGVLVLANAGLWAAYLRRAETPPSASAPVISNPPEVPSLSAPPPAPVRDQFWTGLQSEDPVQFAANLRTAGVPEPTVRLLVSGQLRAAYLARQHELFGAAEPAPYGQPTAAAESRERLVALRTLARAQQELLRRLFGVEDGGPAVRDRQRRQYGSLPDAKLDQLDGIQSDYDEIAAEVRSKAGGLLLPEEREALELLERERRKDIASVLTPTELEQFDLLNSPEARALRNRLVGFAPTEQEFRKVFLLQREFDEKFARPNSGGLDAAKRSESLVAEQELETRLRAALGDMRFAEYRRQNDSGYRMAVRIAERFGLPAQRAAEVYTLAQEVQLQLQILRSDRVLAPEAALQSLATLHRETNEKLGALLGAEGAEAYQQTSSGAWLRTMDRVVRSASSAAPAPVVAAPPSSAVAPNEPVATIPAEAATIAPAEPGAPAVPGEVSSAGP